MNQPQPQAPFQSPHLSLLVDRLFPLTGPLGPTPEAAVLAARRLFDMDVAVLARFRDDGCRELRHVEARDAFLCPLETGAVLPLDEGYCRRMTAGEIPGLIPDTWREPAVMDLPATRALPIGAYLGVPVRLPDGELYGSLCCFSFQARPALGQRELDLLQALAARVGEMLATEQATEQAAGQPLAPVAMPPQGRAAAPA